MNSIAIFAGFPACTSSDDLMKNIAALIAIGIIIGGALFIRKWNKQKGNTRFSNTTAGKIIFNLFAIPFLLFVALYAYLSIAPWCSSN